MLHKFSALHPNIVTIGSRFGKIGGSSRRIWRTGWRLLCALLVVCLSMPGLFLARPVVAQSGITSPTDGASVSGAVAVSGTAVIDPFQKYELHYKQEPSGDDAFIYFDGGTVQVTGGQLGVWQAGGLPPGTYTLRLRVVKNDGNYAEYYTRNLSVNQGPAQPEPTPTPEEEDAEAVDLEGNVINPNEPTPTPIPTATFTPAPQPTPVVGAVAQPELAVAPTPTPTPEEVAVVIAPGGGDDGGESLAIIAGPTAAVVEPGGSVTRELGEALALNRLRESFFNGVRFSAALFFGAVAIYAGKRLFDWAWTQFS